MNNDVIQQLNKLFNEQTFEIELTNKEKASFKQLTTIQLTKLVETVIDSPVTQAIFNATVAEIMLENSKNKDKNPDFNIIDQMLFLLETRIQTLGKTQKVVKNGKSIEINFEDIIKSLKAIIETKSYIFQTKTVEIENVKLTYGIPTVMVDYQLQQEEYLKNFVIINDMDELRKILGEMFLNEIAKTIKTITINGVEEDLSQETFKSRKKIVETLPASIIKNIISFVETYKKDIDECYVVEDGIAISLDGTMFSLQ